MAKLKASKSDFQGSMLPHNRKEVFWDVLKMHWKSLLTCGLVMFLFSLPMHFFGICEFLYRGVQLADFDQLSPEEQEKLLYGLLSLNNTRAMFNIFSFLFLAIGMAGMVRVIRQYAWEENVYFRADFPRGIGQNLKQVSLLALLVGIGNALVVYGCNLASLTDSSAAAIGMVLAVCVAALVGIPTAGYALVAISLYENSFVGNLRLGFVMAAKTMGRSLLAVVCCLAPFALQWIPNLYCLVFGRILGALVSPVVLLGWYLFALEQYDRLVNATRFPELVGKGTFPAE